MRDKKRINKILKLLKTMRDKKRINKILKLLKTLWEQSPDKRFGQLLINLRICEDEYRLWSNEDNDLEKYLTEGGNKEMTFNWTIIIFIIIALVATDKLLTVANINAVKQNFPTIDPLSIEKNPVAREFFKQHGLMWGTITYGLFSLICFFFIFFNLFLYSNVPNTLVS